MQICYLQYFKFKIQMNPTKSKKFVQDEGLDDEDEDIIHAFDQEQSDTKQFLKGKSQQEQQEDDVEMIEFDDEQEGKKNHQAPTNLKEWIQELNEEYHSEDEGIEDYKIGGYHPCHIGQVLINRYVLIQKLGWGHFSTVWLAKDFKHGTYAAVKVMKSAPHYLDASYDQVQILQKIAKLSTSPEWIKSVCHYKNKKLEQVTRDDTHVLNLLNCFLYKGPYGNHFCMVYEILGVNLLEVLKRTQYKGLPLDTVREMTKQILIGLDFLNRICKIIHTDLKPENVLLCLTDNEIKKIVQDGQLTSHDVFMQRLRYYRKNFGFGNGEISQSEQQPQQKQEKVQKSQQLFDQESSIAATQATYKLNQLKYRLENEPLNKNMKKTIKKKIKKLEEQIAEEAKKPKQQKPKLKPKVQKPKSQHHHQIRKDILSRAINPKLVFDKVKPLEDGFKIKIADLGNACWTHYHFATEIQTRQYRGPEVILGSKYNITADLWSLACMTFEMLTGDLLFNPKRDANQIYGKNDDHIAQMMELLGIFPKKFSKRCSKYKKYFANNCKLKRVQSLQQWSIHDFMIAKYGYTIQQAQRFEDFMKPMLNCLPQSRATAQKMLEHPWLRQTTVVDKMSQTEHQQIRAQRYTNTDQHRDQVWNYQSDREDASVQDNNVAAVGTDDEDEQWYGKDTKYKRISNIRLIDQSFTDVGYTGYSEGIDLQRLDAISNWQFD